MFTGIVETTGQVRDVIDEDGGRRVRVGADLDGLAHGQSIAIDGTCLTVENHDDGWFELFCSTETLERTTLSTIAADDAVNIERALPADGRFDGHFVQGHVDATAELRSVERIGDDWEFAFSLPESVARYVVEKGSITVDGISLTVADLRADSFTVAVIPATYDLTALSEKQPGDPINLEVDVIAKYVERLTEGYR
ncbi:riboflavin synthase [Halococcus saccharolyticus]|uniref:Riboflavin synthase n=1 Tax=Halococcus saccharolyticus DSM 5350 TaxID=1227455 RepID=M0MJK6_9EURY|nr:riboflavin synthase [Halococcus saccharolyticus]EMA45856.1 riboflavin synthase subunit alpha [Halococcus saccharolyticus DSM 5350]